MHLVWQVKEKWEHYRWPITTDPGLYWLENPMNVDGTAILAPGQYRGAYRIGKHRDDYQAVVQTGGEVAVYRDDDRNALLDPSKSVNGLRAVRCLLIPMTLPSICG